MQYWLIGMREAFGMGSAFIMLNLPLSIVYLYHPESRQWPWLAVLAVPGLILPAMCAVTRMFRMQAGLSVLAVSCSIGGAIAAAGHHMALMALAHIGIYLGDRVGTTRLPASLQTEISFWKTHFAETAGYWQPNAKDMLDLMLMFGGVAALTAAYLIGRQKLTAFGLQPVFAKSTTQAPSHSLKMPV
jgi:hypothetical protein